MSLKGRLYYGKVQCIDVIVYQRKAGISGFGDKKYGRANFKAR